MPNFDLFDSYFSGKLSKDEIKAFNQRLQDDPDFNAEFQELKEIKYSVRVRARQDAHVLFDKIEERIDSEGTGFNINPKRLLINLTTILLIVFSVYYAIDVTSEPSTKKLFEEYYKSPNSISQPTGNDTDNDISTLNGEAYLAYEMENFSLASRKFRELTRVEKNAYNYFFQGISNIEDQNYELAIDNFNRVINGFEDLNDEATWYLSMALLANDSEDEAIANLAVLALNNLSTYRTKCVEILQKLETDFSNTIRSGSVEQFDQRPRPNETGPSFAESRRFQFGVISDLASGREYFFHSEKPIEGLQRGDAIEYIVIRKSQGRQNKGFALITEKF